MLPVKFKAANNNCVRLGTHTEHVPGFVGAIDPENALVVTIVKYALSKEDIEEIIKDGCLYVIAPGLGLTTPIEITTQSPFLEDGGDTI